MSGMFRGASASPTAHSRPSAVQCSAYKGFGGSSSKRKGAGGKSGTAKSPQQAADRALAEASRTRPNVRPVDPKEAARGKVDYVQVKDWAGGQAPDIGDLQVVPGSVGTGYSTGGTSSSSAAAAAAAADQSAPFYQQLAHHAQFLERQGALSIANTVGAKPYMPFESWQYSLPRYRQYLAEVAAVHLALEGALRLALAAPALPAAAAAAADIRQAAHNSSSSSNDGSTGQAHQGWALPGRDAAVLQAYGALECFGPSSGLWRAAAAQADLQSLCSSDVAAGGGAAGEASTAGSAKQPLGAAQQQHKDNVHASQNAVAYGKYLLQLGNAAAVATEAAAACAVRSSDASVAEEAEGAGAALKLLAHAYALQVQQQCLGTRIGAAATDKLQLLPARAVRLYMDYPDTVRGEPVQQLMQITDAAGQQLDAAGRQAVLEELPKALKKSALMLAPLATAE